LSHNVDRNLIVGRLCGPKGLSDFSLLRCTRRFRDFGAVVRERIRWRLDRRKVGQALGGAVVGAVMLGVGIRVPAALALADAARADAASSSTQAHVTEARFAAAQPSGTTALSAAAQPSAVTAAPSTAARPAGAPKPVLPLSVDQVAAHLGNTLDWFRHMGGAGEQAQAAGVDTASQEKLHQQSLTALALAVDFGRACAALLNEQARGEAAAAAAGEKSGSRSPADMGGHAASAAGAEGSNSYTASSAVKDSTDFNGAATSKGAAAKGFAGRLDEASESLAQRVATLQSQLDDLKEQLAHARGKQRETLLAQQGQAEAALSLAREVQGSVQAMEDFEANSIAGDNGNLSPLEGQIADIERSVPELRRVRPHFAGTGSAGAGGSDGATDGGRAAGAGSAGRGNSGATSGASANNTSSGAAAPAQKNTNTFRPESAGVIALISNWLTLNNTRRQLKDLGKETEALRAQIGKLRGTLTDEVRTVLGNDLAIGTSTDPNQLLTQRQELEADSVRFKKLSTVLVPLGEQALTTETVGESFSEWRDSINAHMSTVARYMALRIGVVLGWVVVVLVISEVWRRATFRYLHDLRRRRQFTALRRVAVGIALTLVLAFGLVSEIGSIATYIGFVTAGVAVALQNVILAVVAYFFFIGRYGVRVGDRVTLAGVTGRVVDIGLVRIYLMELSGPDLHSTGRMVVLSNAVLFQPTAMFKQIPGADFAWHTATLTIAATADVVEAHKRLKAASDNVYAKYRAAIERQHEVVQRFIDFDATSPQPEVRVRLTENGLECSVRYPVELENAAVIDQQMLKALQAALEGDAQFKLVSSGAVVLKSE
jgi:small-conductance mechanosensitive channel